MSKFLTAALAVSIGLFALSLSHFIEWSSFTAVTLKASIGFGAVVLADRFLLRGFDTAEELRKKNTAVAIAFLGVCVVIGSAVIAS